MRRPAVFFDRDNTLIACHGYLGDPAKVVLVKDAADAVARMRGLGYAVVVFSNQSGVARGIFTEEAVHSVNARLDELLTEANPAAVIDRHEFCPFHPDGSVEEYRKESPLRKPEAGMIYQAGEKLALDLSRSWVIGDAPRDIEAGKKAGCRTILFQDPTLAPSEAQKMETTVLPDHFVQSLEAAVKIIEQSVDREIASEALATPPAVAVAPAPPVDLSKVEDLLSEMIVELKKLSTPAEAAHERFSITKLLAGVMQVIALAVLVLAYFARPEHVQTSLLIGIMLQIFTVALLIMDRQE